MTKTKKLTQKQRDDRYRLDLIRNDIGREIEGPIIFGGLALSVLVMFYNPFLSVYCIISFWLSYCFYFGKIVDDYAQRKFDKQYGEQYKPYVEL